jgi:signal transduction histidine kinase
MPISQNAFVRLTLVAVILGLAALLAIVSATFWLVNQTRKDYAIVRATTQQRAELISLRVMLLNAETGQRGYLLTGKDSYLPPYEEAHTKVGHQLEVVSSLLVDPTEKVTFDELAKAVSSKMAELAKTVELAAAGHRDEALELVNTDAGRDLMTEARETLAVLIGRADTTLGDAIAEQQNNIAGLRFVTFAGALVIFVVSVGGAVTVLRYTAQLAKAQREVQDLNAGLEERVNERTADLGRANDEIQRFAYIVTHDLRAPLVNIMGFTSELETSLAPIQGFVEQSSDAADSLIVKNARTAAFEDLPEAIGFIRSSTRKMDGLINAILKLSREGRRSLKPELIDLTVTLHTVIDNIQHQLTDAGGTVSIDGRVPPIISDRFALDQIFGNLLDNAVKYRDPNRPLAIHIRLGSELGRQIFVAVEDNGRGIARQDHERVFDLFRRSGSQDQPGEGIGLAHVRSMARNLGGDIMITSELGRGTTFKVHLPRDLRRVNGVA